LTTIDFAADRPEFEHGTTLGKILSFLCAALLQVIVSVSEWAAVQIFLDLQSAAGRITNPEFIVIGQWTGTDDVALAVLHTRFLTLDVLVQQLVGGAIAQGD
jgi:hypothetical protein